MRTIAIALVLAGLAMPGLARAYNHYDPADLVAHARQSIAEGDLATACVLLSRASKLAPHDARVALAWGDYEAAQNGVAPRAPDPAQPAAVAPAAPASPARVPPEPPALWPPR